MNEAKKKRLIERGWKVGGVEEFLQLSPDEAAYVELRLKLSDSLRVQRQKKNLTQVEFAKLVKSSQSRVAKMEAGDSSISLDLLIRSLLALGASNRDLANMIGQDYHDGGLARSPVGRAQDVPDIHSPPNP
ncbi:MAG: helix-turn-helix transcriptional regulator [Candidatus Competibacter sp.]|nr:helix-turn-helix transcriptional regulator [Candidatus Competibacter sp.]